MYMQFSLQGSYKWLNLLPQIIDSYNNTWHRTIRMKPSEVDSDNEQHLLDTVYNYKSLGSSLASTARILLPNGRHIKLERRKAIFKIGQHVRISKYRKEFDKGYHPNFTTEVFTIRKVQYNTDPITYLLSDYQNQNIEGGVYAEELIAVKNPDIYLVEKVLRVKNKMALVKWLGFSSDHNSWIPEKDIL